MANDKYYSQNINGKIVYFPVSAAMSTNGSEIFNAKLALEKSLQAPSAVNPADPLPSLQSSFNSPSAIGSTEQRAIALNKAREDIARNYSYSASNSSGASNNSYTPSESVSSNPRASQNIPTANQVSPSSPQLGSNTPSPIGSIARNIGAAVAPSVAALAGSATGSALANAVTGSQNSGLGASIGGGIGSIVGGIVGGSASGAATFGVGTFGGSVIGTAIGSTVGSFLGGLLDNAFGKKPTNTNLSRSANTSAIVPPTLIGGQSPNIWYFADVGRILKDGQVDQPRDSGYRYLGPISPLVTSSGWYMVDGRQQVFTLSGRESYIEDFKIYRVYREDGQRDTGGNLGGADNSGKPYIPSALAPPLPVEYTGNPNLVGFSDRDGDDFSKFGRWDPPPVAKPNGVPNDYKPVGEKAPPAANPTPAKNGSPNPTASGNPTANNDPKSPTRASDFTFSGVGNPEIPQSQPIPSSSPATKIPVNPTGTSTPTPSPDALQVIGAVTAVGATVAALKVGSDILVNNSLSNTAKIDQIANNTTPTAQQTNAKQGVCDAMQPQQCGYEGVKAATTDATNPIKDGVNNNAGLLAQILAALANLASTIANLFNGLGAVTNAILNNQFINHAMNYITMISAVHNAAMLSRSLVDTLGSALDSGLQIFGLQLKDKDANQIGVGQAIGTSFQNAIKSIIGNDNWTALNNTWVQANRVYQTGINLLSNVQSILDSTTAVAELTNNRLGTFMNAVRNAGGVRENAYGAQSENVNRFNANLERLQNLEQGVSNLSSITGNIVSVQQSVNEIKTNRQEFENALKDKPQGSGLPENTPQKEADTKKKNDSKWTIGDFSIVKPPEVP